MTVVKANCFVITGCSAGGKSTLIEELERRDYPVVKEAGREIVREQRLSGGGAVPWDDQNAFCDLLFDRSLAAFDSAPVSGSVFFDRSIIEPLVFADLINKPIREQIARKCENRRYADIVFVAAPWKELFVNDVERQQDWPSAVCEYDLLIDAFTAADYMLVQIPQIRVTERADFIIDTINKMPSLL